jgi:uncharacterized protein (UPF0548 family)
VFCLRRPSSADIRRFVSAQADSPYSYAAVGNSRTGAPPGFVVDHNRVRIGQGESDYRRAIDAVCRWEMFNLTWVSLCWPDAPVKVGTGVAVLVKHLGVWSLNATRIVYVVADEGDVQRFGFAYGTLADHVESGEERFTVEWRQADDSVWYDIFAFSQPRHPLAKIGKPVSRSLQRRFARDSMSAMVNAVAPVA